MRIQDPVNELGCSGNGKKGKERLPDRVAAGDRSKSSFPFELPWIGWKPDSAAGKVSEGMNHELSGKRA